MNKLANSQNAASVEVEGADKFQFTINADSSNLKFSFFNSDIPPVKLFFGGIDSIGSLEAIFTFKNKYVKTVEHVKISTPNYVSSLDYLLRYLARMGITTFIAFGYPVVYGGASD